jgi:polysaccharide biosynthesis transport protein
MAMKSSLSYYTLLVKRWTWLVILGIGICSGATFLISKFLPPLYQASSMIVVSINSSTSAYDNLNASVQAIPTYVDLLTNPEVLNPVVAQHQGLTLEELKSMMSVKPQANTQLIELDVENRDPVLAAQLANEIGRSFAQFANEQFPGTVQILPAQKPTDPVRPKPLLYTGIAAIVGLGLALALILMFEWTDDRLTRLEEAEELLGMDLLAMIPCLSRRQRKRARKAKQEVPALAEACRMLAFSLTLAQETKPFKLLMISSALPGEGKSLLAVHLATFLAQTGKRVLLVDANMRRPALDHYLQVERSAGLAGVLHDMSCREERNIKVIDTQATAQPRLQVLTTESAGTNPADMLQACSIDRLFDYFERAPFDYILFDTPPLLPVADAQILASRVPATILLVDASRTPRKALMRAKRLLERARTTTLGLVLNKSQWSDYSTLLRYASDRQRQSKQPASDELGKLEKAASPPVTAPVDEEMPIAMTESFDQALPLVLPLSQSPTRDEHTS